MARANTSSFHELILAVELDPDGAPDDFKPICGLRSKSINIGTENDTAEVPDCDNEELPLEEQVDVRLVRYGFSGSGVWAVQNHALMLTWAGTKLRARVTFAKIVAEGAIGDVESFTGPCILSGVVMAVDKGGRMTAELTGTFDGEPEKTLKST